MTALTTASAARTRARIADYYPDKDGRKRDSAASVALFLSIDPNPHWIVSWWIPVLIGSEDLYVDSDFARARDAWFQATGVNLFEYRPVYGSYSYPWWLYGEAADLATQDPSWVSWGTAEWAERMFPPLPPLPPPPQTKAAQIVQALLHDLGKRGLCLDEASTNAWVKIVEKHLQRQDL